VIDDVMVIEIFQDDVGRARDVGRDWAIYSDVFGINVEGCAGVEADEGFGRDVFQGEFVW